MWEIPASQPVRSPADWKSAIQQIENLRLAALPVTTGDYRRHPVSTGDIRSRPRVKKLLGFGRVWSRDMPMVIGGGSPSRIEIAFLAPIGPDNPRQPPMGSDFWMRSGGCRGLSGVGQRVGPRLSGRIGGWGPSSRDLTQSREGRREQAAGVFMQLTAIWCNLVQFSAISFGREAA
jgi:hypothetical protein